MSLEEDIAIRSEDIKGMPDKALNWKNQSADNQESVCQFCGAHREKMGDECAECGVVFESSASSVAMVPCPMCDGTGTIFLKYLDGYALAELNHEQRCLPCADCDGTGEIPRHVIVGRQKKELRKQLLVILLELLDGLTRR